MKSEYPFYVKTEKNRAVQRSDSQNKEIQESEPKNSQVLSMRPLQMVKMHASIGRGKICRKARERFPVRKSARRARRKAAHCPQNPANR